MAVKQLSDGGPDGTVLGQDATDLIGFFGVTPVAQQSVTAPNPSATTGTNEAAIVSINTALVNLGLYVTT